MVIGYPNFQEFRYPFTIFPLARPFDTIDGKWVQIISTYVEVPILVRSRSLL